MELSRAGRHWQATKGTGGAHTKKQEGTNKIQERRTRKQYLGKHKA